MRMQLNYKLFGMFILLTFLGKAQDLNEQIEASAKADAPIEAIEIDILSSYYEQDGNNSPVTGGTGTEKLDNIAPSIIINIPLDSIHSINLSGGVDVYSSASSDNINNPTLEDNHVSSASAQDARGYGTIGYKKKNLKAHSSWSTSLGFSTEYDVTSLSIGGGYSKSSKDNNREISFKGKYYLDNWKLIYPTELRNGVTHLSINQRHSFNFSATGSTFLTKRVAASLNTDFVYQNGLLSTPFHRVYFKGSNSAVVEQLPNSRIKVPIGVRVNWNISDRFIWRNHYRYYWDNWGVNAHSYQTELTVKLSESVRLYPFYRYHQQTAADYFGGYQELSNDAAYFTADYDLSALSSHKFGMGIAYSPIFGVARWKSPIRKNKANQLKEISFRYANYQRSNGLSANVFTIGLKFNLDNGGWKPDNWKLRKN